MGLAETTQAAIEGVAHASGLSLTADQVRNIAQAESACLSASRRISFGESAAVRVVREFAESPFIAGDDAANVFMELTEAFYEMREDFPASITDAEILEQLAASFNGDAAGSVGLATTLAGESLSKQLASSTYEIVDDDGNVYRWDPEEWHDDAMADGWSGERWEDVDE